MGTGNMVQKQSKRGRSEGRQGESCKPAERPLPPSGIDPDDYPSGPTGSARYLEDCIEELEARKCEDRTRAERKSINKKLHVCRDLLAWCKTRAGYGLMG